MRLRIDAAPTSKRLLFRKDIAMSNFTFLLSGEGAGSQNGLGGTLIMIAVLLLVFWLFMIRPQKKREKEEREMRDTLAIGDEVTTIGGIIGKVVSIKGDTFVLETTKDKTKIRFLKGAIRSVDVKAADIAAAVVADNQKDQAAEKTDTTADVKSGDTSKDNAKDSEKK